MCFTLITTCFATPSQNFAEQAKSVDAGPKNVFETRWWQQIAMALDIITGVGLIIAGIHFGLPVVAVIGGLQVAPLIFFITNASRLIRSPKLCNLPFFVKYSPCCGSCCRSTIVD